MAWYRKLHWQIILGLVLGTAFGAVAAVQGWGGFVADWVAPFGTIFINGLKLIAVPLILASLVTGVASLSDLKKLSRIGGKTIGIYIATTAVAVTLGLLIVNLLQPGTAVPETMRAELASEYAGDAAGSLASAANAEARGPLQVLVDLVPDNFFAALTAGTGLYGGDGFSNGASTLQVVFLALLLGIGLIQVPKEAARPLLAFFESLNDVVIRLVDLIMLMAPVGVFALIAGTITTLAGDDVGRIVALLGALGYYCIAVLVGLALHTLVVYPSMLKLFTPMNLKTFFAGMGPAQLVAFSTSSSGATLPVTMERCEEKLGISEEVSSFVLPLGATINMDGTALYQAIAAVFIAQALGMDLSLAAQLTIVLTAVLASIGTAAVPGAGIIMLVIILQSVDVPAEGIALILGVDRILDMCRTVTNVTGDATVATIVAASEGQLNTPDLSPDSDRVVVAA